jgi:hypothetical protein
MLFVTFHGGKPEKNPHKNNVHAYDKDGKQITASVLDDTEGVILDELRGIYFFRNLLYVAIANKMQNNLLCYQGSDTHYRFVSRFASQATCKGILHPFDLTFDGTKYCYVSSQDTNLVTRLTVSADGKTGTPAPIASALVGTFLSGTFVASSVGTLSDPATTPVPQPMGLQYSAEGAKKHSVRGVAWINDALYVVDQPAGRVKTDRATKSRRPFISCCTIGACTSPAETRFIPDNSRSRPAISLSQPSSAHKSKTVAAWPSRTREICMSLVARKT